MDIRSTPSGFTPRPTGHARNTAPASSSRPVGQPASGGDEMMIDRVELSPAAIELNTQMGGGTPAPALTGERIQQVAARMTSGFYDRAETVDRVVERIFSEIAGPDAG